MSDRTRAALSSIVQTDQRQTPYAIFYPCTIIKDWGDMTLDLRPDDTDLLPMLSRIPLRVGIPGLKIKVKAGGRVMLAFDNAEADAPLAFLFDGGDLEMLEFSTASGQTIKLDDDRGQTSDDASYAGAGITVSDSAGNTVHLQASPTPEMAFTHASGSTLKFDMAGNVTVVPALKFLYRGLEVAVITALTPSGPIIRNPF